MIPEKTELIACPVCDTLYRIPVRVSGAVADCTRCGYPLALGQRRAISRVVALAAAAAILMIPVLFAPFLEMQSAGIESRASIVDVIFVFKTPLMVPLSFAVLILILVLPWLRFGLLLYALIPALVERAPLPQAPRMLRWAMWLRPWAMAEIFMVGVGVALIKLADLATLFFGPAFWAFAGVVGLTLIKDTQMCRSELWAAVSPRNR